MSILQQLNQEAAGIVSAVQTSLVRVLAGSRGAGAGTIWHPDGLIVTNAHVVGDGRGLQVALPDGRNLPARLLASSREQDLAALMIEADDLPTIPVGDSRTLQPGAWVTAMGHPWGVRNAATSGVVIGVGRHLPELPVQGPDWVVVSLHLRPGHSGGPLFDVGGRLVGINTMMTGPDVGVAVAVDSVKAFLRRALNTQPATQYV